MTDLASADARPCILPFDPGRMRAGLRIRIAVLRRLIIASGILGHWRGGDITPAMILDCLPDDEDLFSMGEQELARRAVDASILGLAAIHGENWDARTLLGDILDLQSAGVVVREGHHGDRIVKFRLAA